MMKKIDCSEKKVGNLLSKKHKLDYYQREYNWETKQVNELLDDLIGKFDENYNDDHNIEKTLEYGPYFLGSIIISEIDGQRHIIDGQQRLTTLTLLLIHLRHLLKNGDQKSEVARCILSGSFVKKSFNLDIPDRDPIMNALYNNESYDENDKLKSIRNIAARYRDIKKHFELPEPILPYFVHWLLERVYFAEIIVYSDEDAYTIFETMNDRGLSLTKPDMLRGYLLSNISDPEYREKVSEVWKNNIQRLQNLSKKSEDDIEDAIKAWLRSQYAESSRDYERIGSEFHRWVREQENKLDLITSDAFANFIEQDFEFYSSWFLRLRDAATFLTPRLECIYYNAQNNFTLQYTLLLSPLKVGDTEEEALRKIQIVSTYLDIFINRRIWNGDSIARNNMDNYIWRDQRITNENTIVPILPLIRGKSSQELVDILYRRINVETKPIGSTILHLHNQNRKPIRLILARMTDYIEVQSKQSSRYHEYVKAGKNSYEVEHIWAENHFEWHKDDFSHELEFEGYRNRIGGLLLLPKNNNISYGNSPYREKREHYLKENLLAQSLHEKAYEKYPGFKQFIENSKLLFCPHPNFKKEDLNERQKLYQSIAKRIWNPERLKLPYGHEPDPATVENEDDNPVTLRSVSENGTWTTERISNLVPPDRKEFFEKQYANHKIYKCYSLMAELKNLVQDKKWHLTLKFQKHYCAFYFGDSRVFGVDLYSSPRFAVWITKAEAESLSDQYNFAHYSTSHRRAVYPKNTALDSLLPIFEFAYKKHQGY